MPQGLVDRYAGVVCDLDGVVYRGHEAVQHAVCALESLPVPVVYATNNASRPPAEVAAHLARLGLGAAASDVVTSSQAGASHLSAILPPGSPVLAVGGPGVRDALQHSGLHPVLPSDSRRGGGAVAAVLQGYGADVTASDLAEAAYAVSAGVPWVATNTDATLPTERGTAPGNGTLVAAVQRATGVEPVVVGKPQAPLYGLCADRLGSDVGRLLAVGDRLDTDIAGAVTARMDSVLVLTGVDSVTSLAGAGQQLRPTFVVEDLRALTEPYVGPVTDQTWWCCGSDRRRLVDGRWEVAREGTPLEAARAALAAVHEALDQGELEPGGARALVSDLDRWQ
ncbi:MAG TPA: HAD-IIA family hydrolase [Pedococcus sp.]|jgi:glycerol 3-phosphatase-2